METVEYIQEFAKILFLCLATPLATIWAILALIKKIFTKKK